MKMPAKFFVVIALFSPLFAFAESSHTLESIAVFSERSAPATVLSLNHSTLSAQIGANVEDIHVRVSQQVKKGDRLLSLECNDYDLQLESSKAALDAAKSRAALAESQRERAQQLLEKKLLSTQQWESRNTELLASEASVRQAEVAVKQAQLSVKRCVIRSPFDGVVTQRLASVGQLANVGTPLMTVVDQSNLEVSAQVSTNDAQLFTRVDAFRFDFGKQIPLKLHNLGNVIDVNTRSQEVRLLLGQEKVLPGTAGKLRWLDPRPSIPAKYIVKEDGQLGVYVVRDSGIEFVMLPQASPGRDVVVALPLDTVITTEPNIPDSVASAE